MESVTFSSLERATVVSCVAEMSDVAKYKRQKKIVRWDISDIPWLFNMFQFKVLGF